MATYTILVTANANQALTSTSALQSAFGSLNQTSIATSANLQRAFEAAAAGARTLGLAIAAAGAALAGFSLAALIKEGFRFNQVLENTRLSIASLVAAFDRTDGRAVGEKLSVGLTIAQDQLKKLRVDALTTSATFEELATGFQTAIGTGLGKGLNLDQIRTLTLQIGQAAKVFNLASNQITSEIKDILSGNITRNSTIATSLGIERADIERLKGNADELFKFLQDKLGSFRQAGVLAASTFSGLLSNASEAFTTLAASATEKTFEATKKRLSGILGSVFDLKNSGLDKSIQPIVDLFDRIGVKVVNGIGDGLEFVINKVKDFGRLLADNPDLVDRIVARFEELVTAVTEVFKSVVSAFDPSNGRDFLYQLEQALILTRRIVEVMGTVAEIVAVVGAGLGEIFRAVVYGGEQDYEKILAKQALAERALKEAEERRKREEEAAKKKLPTITTDKQKPDEIKDLEAKISEAKRLRDALRSGGGELFNLEENKAALDEEVKRLRDILKLRRELGINENQRIAETLEGQRNEIDTLQKIKSAREALVALTRQQADAQLAISQAAAASLLPVVDAQTRADRIFFESIRNRKEAEADLQAQIIQQIRERTDIEAQSVRDRATQLGVIQEQISEADQVRQRFIATATRLALSGGDSSPLRDLQNAANRPPVIPTKIDTTNTILGDISKLVREISERTKTGLRPVERTQLESAGVISNRADARVMGGTAQGNLRAFLDTIAFAEGTDKRGTGGGYNVKVGGGTFSDLSRKDTRVIRLSPTLESSAAGRYQFLNKTWAELQATLNLPDFGPDSQDRAAMELIRRAGAIPDIEAGNFDVAARKVRKIWASFPGAGYGQRELSLDRLRSVFASRTGGQVTAGAMINDGSISGGIISGFIEAAAGGNQPAGFGQRFSRASVNLSNITPVTVTAGDSLIQASPESNFVRNLDGSQNDPFARENSLAQRFFGRNFDQLTRAEAEAGSQRGQEIEDARKLYETNEALLELDRNRLNEIIAFNSKLDEQAQRRRVEIDQVTERARLEERIRKLQEGDPTTARELRQTFENSVLVERANLLEQNLRLEFDIGNAGVNSAERLRNAYLSATKARVDAELQASEQIIRTQVEIEDKYRYSQTQTTAIVLDNLNRQTKSLSQIVADYQTGLFDLVNNGLGRGIDAITKKLGFAGSLVGQLLKDLARLALNKIFLGLLGLNGGGGGGLGALFGGGGLGQVGGTPGFAGGGGGFGGLLGGIFGNFGRVGGTPGFAGGTGGGLFGGGGIGSLFGLKGVGGVFDKLTGGFSGGESPAATLTRGSGGISGIAGTILSGALNKTIGGAAGLKLGLAGGRFAGLGLLAPLLGAQFGSRIGGTLGGIGGLLLGGTALAGLAGTAGIAGALTGLGVGAGTAAGFAGAAVGLLTNPFTIIAGVGLLIGGFLLGRARQRRADEKQRDAILGDTLKQLNELLDGVRRNKVDGKSAISNAESIRSQYLQAINALKTGSVRRSALRNQLPQVDRKIADIKAAAERQDRAREVAETLIPEFATGGSVAARFRFMGAFANGRSFSGRVPGVYDRKDDKLALLSGDETVLTPAQRARLNLTPQKLRAAGVPGYADGTAGPAAGGAISGEGMTIYLYVNGVLSEEQSGKIVKAGFRDASGKEGAMDVIVRELREGR